MARPRKPLDLQTGNLTQKQQSEKEIQEGLIIAGSEQLDKVPSWLGKEAKKEWKRLVKELRTIKVISNLDYRNLENYCNAYEEHLSICKDLKDKDKIIKHTNKAGFTNEVPNPGLKVQKFYSDEMTRYAGLLGLSIDSRLKIATLKSNETKGEIVDEFGDI